MEQNLKNNPHYQNGYFWGRKMAQNIEKSNYKTLDNAIAAKEELVEDLKKEFGWTEEDKDVAENLGLITALKEELALKEPFKLTRQHVEEVLQEFQIIISEEQMESILSAYDATADENPGSSWQDITKALLEQVL